MTQKQQQAFRKKKLRGKKKVNFKRFFLLAGILVAAIAITVAVYRCNDGASSVPDSQKLFFMIPAYLLYLATAVFSIQCMRRCNSIMPFIICAYCMIIFDIL